MSGKVPFHVDPHVEPLAQQQHGGINPYKEPPVIGGGGVYFPPEPDEPLTPAEKQRLDENARRALDSAQVAVRKTYLSYGGAYPIGMFGKPVSQLTPVNSSTYDQVFEWGRIQVRSNGPGPDFTVKTTQLRANITIAAVKCLGTDDPSGTDEAYLVVSVTSPQDAFPNKMGVSKTWRSPVRENTHEHDVFFIDTQIGDFRDVPVGAAGLDVHILVMDQEQGSPDEVRNQLQGWADAVAQDYRNAADTMKQSGDPGGALDNTGNSEVLDKLKAIALKVVANWFADDKIGELNFHLTPDWLSSIEGDQAHEASRVNMRNEIPASIFVNFPAEKDDPFNGRWLFTNGDGTYKVYLNVQTYWVLSDE